MKKLVFDIMVGDKFYRTMRMPITLDVIVGYDGEMPIYDIKKIEEWVLQKCPTLKHDNYRICF
jgi:hypothetical protein